MDNLSLVDSLKVRLDYLRSQVDELSEKVKSNKKLQAKCKKDIEVFLEEGVDISLEIVNLYNQSVKDSQSLISTFNKFRDSFKKLIDAYDLVIADQMNMVRRSDIKDIKPEDYDLIKDLNVITSTGKIEEVDTVEDFIKLERFKLLNLVQISLIVVGFCFYDKPFIRLDLINKLRELNLRSVNNTAGKFLDTHSDEFSNIKIVRKEKAGRAFVCCLSDLGKKNFKELKKFVLDKDFSFPSFYNSDYFNSLLLKQKILFVTGYYFYNGVFNAVLLIEKLKRLIPSFSYDTFWTTIDDYKKTGCFIDHRVNKFKEQNVLFIKNSWKCLELTEKGRRIFNEMKKYLSIKVPEFDLDEIKEIEKLPVREQVIIIIGMCFQQRVCTSNTLRFYSRLVGLQKSKGSLSSFFTRERKRSDSFIIVKLITDAQKHYLRGEGGAKFCFTLSPVGWRRFKELKKEFDF